jgi:hypothetical protein
METAQQCLLQLAGLAPQARLGQLSHHDEVAFSGRQSIAHGAAGHADDAGGDRAELDTGVRAWSSSPSVALGSRKEGHV